MSYQQIFATDPFALEYLEVWGNGDWLQFLIQHQYDDPEQRRSAGLDIEQAIQLRDAINKWVGPYEAE